MKLSRNGDRVIIHVEGAFDVINWQEVNDFCERTRRELEDRLGPPQGELEEIESPPGRVFETLDPESTLTNVELREYYEDKADGIDSPNPLEGYERFPDKANFRVIVIPRGQSDEQ